MRCTSLLGFLIGNDKRTSMNFSTEPHCRTTSHWNTRTLSGVLFHHANTCRRVIRLLEMPIERCPRGTPTQQSGITGQE